MPMFQRNGAGDILAEAVDVELGDPIFPGLIHVLPEVSVSVIQLGDVSPRGRSLNNVAVLVLLVELRMRADQVVAPRSVIGNPVHDDVHAVGVDGGDEVLEVFLGAVPRINVVVVTDAVRAVGAGFVGRVAACGKDHGPGR